MSSEVEKKVKVAPSPLVVGSSTLSKIPLSYRWVINDARTFLDNRSSFDSPPLSTILASNKEVVLKITIEKCKYGLGLTLKCCKDTNQQVKVGNKVQFLISECIVTILNPSNEVMLTGQPAQNTPVKFEMGSSMQLLQYTKLPTSDLSRYLFNNTLTIQVDASILCYNSPLEAVSETACKVPLDSIRSELHGMYRDKVLADVTIKCKGKEFKAHKVVLASQSPVLRAMFETNMKERKTNVVEISDIDHTVVSDLLEYMYTGSAPNLSTLAKELLNAADKYELPRLLAMCANEMQNKLNKENVLDVFVLADLHKAMELRSACLKFIIHHSYEIKSTSKWKDFEGNAEKNSASLLVEIMDAM